MLVLLVRAGLRSGEGGGDGKEPGRSGPALTVPATPTATPGVTTRAGRLYYSVRPGDTLDRIALRFGTTGRRLLDLNPGVEPTALNVGQRIRVR